MDAKKESDMYRDFEKESGRTGEHTDTLTENCFDHVAGELEKGSDTNKHVGVVPKTMPGIRRFLILLMCIFSIVSYGLLGIREIKLLKERGGIGAVLQQLTVFDESLLYKRESGIVSSQSALTVMGWRVRLNRDTEEESPIMEKEEPAENNFVGEVYPVYASDLSTDAAYGLALNNETAYKPDLLSLVEKSLASPTVREIYAEYGADAPAVLILHTHATETYMETAADFYSPEDHFHTADPEKNMIAIGAVMAEILNTRGINTQHCTVQHDAESYRDSYARAAETIEEYLEKYPSISYIFDVHRDAIIAADMTQIRPVFEKDGKSIAQFMCVVGTDARGADHPDWEENLIFAAKLQRAMNNTAASVTRPINLRGAAFNEQYTNGSLLLEIGSCGNTLEEAKRCAEMTAECIANVIYG